MAQCRHDVWCRTLRISAITPASRTHRTRNERISIPVILCAEENVQGSHGAAIGELDEETLFYFGARGMDRTQAENTMARAKLEAKIQKIGDADIEQKVKTQLAEVLDRDNR